MVDVKPNIKACGGCKTKYSYWRSKCWTWRQNCRSLETRERYGDGFKGLGGHSANQEAPEVILILIAGLMMALHSHPPQTELCLHFS